MVTPKVSRRRGQAAAKRSEPSRALRGHGLRATDPCRTTRTAQAVPGGWMLKMAASFWARRPRTPPTLCHRGQNIRAAAVEHHRLLRLPRQRSGSARPPPHLADRPGRIPLARRWASKSSSFAALDPQRPPTGAAHAALPRVKRQVSRTAISQCQAKHTELNRRLRLAHLVTKGAAGGFRSSRRNSGECLPCAAPRTGRAPKRFTTLKAFYETTLQVWAKVAAPADRRRDHPRGRANYRRKRLLPGLQPAAHNGDIARTAAATCRIAVVPASGDTGFYSGTRRPLPCAGACPARWSRASQCRWRRRRTAQQIGNCLRTRLRVTR